MTPATGEGSSGDPVGNEGTRFSVSGLGGEDEAGFPVAGAVPRVRCRLTRALFKKQTEDRYA